jgi:hypothetical protein
MVFESVFAAVFYTAVLGTLWPLRSSPSFTEGLLGNVGKSLFLSWLVTAFSYWLNLGNLLVPLVILVAISLALQTWYAFRGRNKLQIKILFWEPVAFLGIAAICVHLFNGGFGSDYRLIFMTGDALDNWHRWGVQLTSNYYEPYTGAYPLLFSGLYSLIYKAQGNTSVWIFAKASLFVVPVILCLSVLILAAYRMFISALLVAIFVAYFFFKSNAWSMLMGNMDIPISSMMLAGGVLMYISSIKLQEVVNDDTYRVALLAAIFVGLTSITKGQGGVMFAPLFLLVVLGFLKQHLTLGKGIVVLCVASVPLAAYLPIYLSLQPNPFGHLTTLANDAVQMSPHGNPMLTAYYFMLGMLPWPAWVVVGLLAAANLISIRRPSGLLGALFFVLGVAGFFFYAKCCSYEARNGWWVLILFATSALFALAPVEIYLQRRLPSWSLHWRMPVIMASAIPLVAAFAFAVLVAKNYDEANVRADQERLQWAIAGTEMGPLLRDNVGLVSPQDRIVSEVNAARWLPTFTERFSLCGQNNIQCIDDAKRAAARIFVLIVPGLLEFPSLKSQLTLSRLVGDGNELQFYGPIADVDNSGQAEPSVIEQASLGEPLELIFRKEACSAPDMAAFECGPSYHVEYNVKSNSWTLAGPNRLSGKEEAASSTNALARPGRISLWGATGVFDRSGAVYLGGSRVGTLKATPH